ncbi:MAG: hypothetical protein RR933_00845 [Oscillospiraceae bacterium]
MKFLKTHLENLPFCYAAATIKVNGEDRYIFATDDKGPCLCINPLSKEIENIWDGPGGTMSIIPIPGKDGDFLASQNFMPGFTAREAAIVRVRYEGGKWNASPWLSVPYIHRFDIIQSGDENWFIGCILSNTDKPSADWSCPGGMVAARLNDSFDAPLELDTIATGMTKNHGYCRSQENGQAVVYVACDEGVFKIPVPESKSESWRAVRILNVHASDVAVCDIDNDGKNELAVIEPFHGSAYVIYHESDSGYKEAYRYGAETDFLHAIWGGELCGEKVFLGGSRAMDKELFAVSCRNGEYCSNIIEKGYGPSNFAVFKNKAGYNLLVANRESGECAVFAVTE